MFSGEYIEDLDTAVALAGSDVLVVGVEAHGERLLGCIPQGILVLNFDLRVLNFNGAVYKMLVLWIMTYVKSAETGV